MTQWHGGKGSRYRKVDQKAYNDNWERIFGKKDMKFTTAEEYVTEVVEWKGSFGYGDMVAAIGYANNLAQKTKNPVRLEWTSCNSEGERGWPEYENPDSEDAIFRFKKLFEMMKTENVDYKIRYDENLPYKHSELPNHPLYFYRYMKPEYKWKGGGGYVVFNTTQNNYVQWKDYTNPKDKSWKSPDSWDNTYENFDNVRFVDYRTPLEELVDILKNCDLFIGYAGGSAQLAQTMGVPMFLYVNEIRRSSGCCPAAVISKKLTFKQEDIPMIQRLALDNIAHCEDTVKTYINSTSDNEDVLDGKKENTKT